MAYPVYISFQWQCICILKCLGYAIRETTNGIRITIFSSTAFWHTVVRISGRTIILFDHLPRKQRAHTCIQEKEIDWFEMPKHAFSFMIMTLLEAMVLRNKVEFLFKNDYVQKLMSL
jgi:hypothetical protein